MTHTVTVYGKQYEVDVYQKSKTVWEAVGHLNDVLAVPDPEHKGREIRVTGQTESSALSLWKKTAEYWAK